MRKFLENVSTFPQGHKKIIASAIALNPTFAPVVGFSASGEELKWEAGESPALSP